MKILNASQIKDWDHYTIKNEPISSFKLMKRAGKECFKKIQKMFPQKKIHIIVNKGNNGGDGLVIFQELQKKKYKVRLSIIDILKKSKSDFKRNKPKVIFFK